MIKTDVPYSKKCSQCLNFFGFRYLSIIIIGLVIGLGGTFYVQQPPFTKILINVEAQAQSTQKKKSQKVGNHGSITTSLTNNF